MSAAPGLYVVGTPIGNLSDLTHRAEQTLATVDLVVAEDTRRARQLLSHLGVTGKRLVCVDAHASPRDVGRIVAELESGSSAALVTDAGMPSISDPGTRLVDACRERGVSVWVVPGPSAVTAALAASGLVDAGFWFVGFLPRKGEKRELILQRIADSEDAVVLFESPHRMQRTLADLAEHVPERRVCVARELTKRFEEVRVARALDWVQEEREWVGELALVVAPRGGDCATTAGDSSDLDALVERRLNLGQSPREIAEALAPLLTLPRREIYQRALAMSPRE